MDLGFPVDGSLIYVSDGLTLPWINGDLNSKLLQQTPASEIAAEADDVGSGHQAEIFGEIFYVRFGEENRSEHQP